MIPVALVAAVMALGTWGFGWWAVPVVGLVVGAGRITTRPVWVAALGATLGWTGLLAWRATGGSVTELATLLGEVMGVPGVAVAGLTLLFPALVAGAAAGVGHGLRVWSGRAPEGSAGA